MSPNSPEALARVQIPASRVWGMLALRSALTLALLLALAAVFGAVGRAEPIEASAAWWLWLVTLTNVVCVWLMIHFGRREGVRLRELSFASRATWRGDLLWALLGFAIIPLVAQPPGQLLAKLLWDDPELGNTLLFQPLPVLAVYPLFALMAPIHALAELPMYWGYVAPRLRARGMNRWLVIVIVGAALSVQHLFFSFIPDWRYALWLAIKFLPFALWTGFLVDRRPTVLPYLMGGHLLIDSALPLLQLMVSQGKSLAG